MKLRPLGNHLLVRRAEAEEVIRGIVIPQTAQDAPHRGTVIAAGPGSRTPDGVAIPLDVAEGDIIIFGARMGVPVTVGGEELLFMTEDAVLAVVEAG